MPFPFTQRMKRLFAKKDQQSEPTPGELHSTGPYPKPWSFRLQGHDHRRGLHLDEGREPIRWTPVAKGTALSERVLSGDAAAAEALSALRDRAGRTSRQAPQLNLNGVAATVALASATRGDASASAAAGELRRQQAAAEARVRRGRHRSSLGLLPGADALRGASFGDMVRQEVALSSGSGSGASGLDGLAAPRAGAPAPCPGHWRLVRCGQGEGCSAGLAAADITVKDDAVTAATAADDNADASSFVSAESDEDEDEEFDFTAHFSSGAGYEATLDALDARTATVAQQARPTLVTIRPSSSNSSSLRRKHARENLVADLAAKEADGDDATRWSSAATVGTHGELPAEESSESSRGPHRVSFVPTSRAPNAPLPPSPL